MSNIKPSSQSLAKTWEKMEQHAKRPVRTKSLDACLALSVRGADVIRTNAPAHLLKRLEEVSEAQFRYEPKPGVKNEWIFERVA